jgi:hypothetical protein
VLVHKLRILLFGFDDGLTQLEGSFVLRLLYQSAQLFEVALGYGCDGGPDALCLFVAVGSAAVAQVGIFRCQQVEGLDVLFVKELR